jgi:hypothetical protein
LSLNLEALDFLFALTFAALDCVHHWVTDALCSDTLCALQTTGAVGSNYTEAVAAMRG